MQIPIIVDVEASGFGPASYPIEVGVALPSGRRYCALVRPEPRWVHWDPEAEALHGIERETLERYGRPVRLVAEELNALLAGKTAYSDGWVVDLPWLRELFFAAGLSMRFRLSPLEAILCEDQLSSWHTVRDEVATTLGGVRHRASIDAEIVQVTYCRTRGGNSPASGSRPVHGGLMRRPLAALGLGRFSGPG